MVRRQRGHAWAALASALAQGDAERLRRMILTGISPSVMHELAQRLGLRVQDVAMVLGASPAHRARSGAQAPLPLAPSDRAVRYVRLVERARAVWEGDAACRDWMTMPAPALGGDAPWVHAATEPGAQRVERLLEQVADGVVV